MDIEIIGPYPRDEFLEAARLWTETTLSAPTIAKKIGTTPGRFAAMRQRNRNHFPARETRMDDPTPEEIEAGKAEALRRREFLEAKGAAVPGGKMSSDGTVGIKVYSFDRRNLSYSCTGVW